MKTKEGFEIIDKLLSDDAIRKGPNTKVKVSENIIALVTSQESGVKKRYVSTA